MGRNAGAVQMSVAMRILGYNCVTVYRTRQGVGWWPTASER